MKKQILNLFRKKNNVDFDKTFSYLKRVEKITPSSKICFMLLKKLNIQTANAECNKLITELHKIQYPSNPTDYFYFFFPIVSHILYYKPQYEKEILHYLVAPNFANEPSEVDEMISVIIGAMKYKLKQDKNYLSLESQHWITNELPKLKKEIQREIEICYKELE